MIRICPKNVDEFTFQFDAEFRRFSVDGKLEQKFEDFEKLLTKLHELTNIPFLVCYTDPKDGDLLPINNDDNYNKALSTARPILRLMVQRKGKFSCFDITSYHWCHCLLFSFSMITHPVKVWPTIN